MLPAHPQGGTDQEVPLLCSLAGAQGHLKPSWLPAW